MQMAAGSQTTPPPACGLVNLGNTCYLNALIQSIAHVPSFVRHLLESGRGPPTGDDGPVCRAVRNVLIAMWANAGALSPAVVVSPAHLLDALAPRMAKLGVDDMRAQNDAHELYGELVDALPSSARRMLKGDIVNQTRCEVCGATSRTIEPFTTVSVAVAPGADDCGAHLQPPDTVSRLLRANFAPERIRGWRCDDPRCVALHREPGTAVRIANLWRLPSVLAVCIKRFVDPMSVSRAEVVPCEQLTNAFLCAVSATGSPAAADAAASPSCCYRLCGMVCHAGSQRHGHYIACVKRPGTGAWHVHDDERTFVGDGSVSSCPPDAHSTSYIVFYELVA